jgi:hypothetical protein
MAAEALVAPMERLVADTVVAAGTAAAEDIGKLADQPMRKSHGALMR